MLALSLALALFCLMGVPPLMGFFGKQTVSSAALDSGYIFIAIVAILIGVISAVYYLSMIKQVFLYRPYCLINPAIYSYKADGVILDKNTLVSNVTITLGSIVLSSSLSLSISILTIITLLFIFIPQEWLRVANFLAIILFNI